MSNDLLLRISKDELFGDEKSTVGGFSFDNRHTNPSLFGPKSGSKVTFPRGLRASKEKLFRIGELIVQGKSDFDVRTIMADEFPDKSVGWRVVAKMRMLIEEQRGPFFCQCGRGINHVEDCDFKLPRFRRNRGLTPDAVKDIRRNYGPKCTLFLLAKKWGVTETAVCSVLKNRTHRVPSLRVAQFKARMYIVQLEKLKSPIDRLLETRTLTPTSGADADFNAELERASLLLDQALEALRKSSRISSPVHKYAQL